MRRRLLFLLLLATFVGIGDNGYATILQLTNNSVSEHSPSLYNGTIAWIGDDTNGYRDIYYWDGSTTQVINQPSTVYEVSVYNGTIAWCRYNEYGITQVYYWDGNSITQITDYTTGSGVSRGSGLSLYNGTIAWVAQVPPNSHRQVYYWDGNTITEIEIGESPDRDDIYPTLYNGTIAWQSHDGYDCEIYYWDGNSIIHITDNYDHDSKPSLYNGTIAWNGQGGIYYWDGNSTTQVISDGGDPSLYDGTIAWHGAGGPCCTQIYYWDGNATIQITNSNAWNVNPSLYNGTVAWESDGEIYYWDGGSFQGPPVADAGADQVVLDTVTLDGTDSYDPDLERTIVSYEWTLEHRVDSSQNRTAQGDNPTVLDLEPGFYDVTLTVTNDNAHTGTDTMLLAAAGECVCTASTMHIQSIIAEISKGGTGQKFGQVTVKVFDNCGRPVSGASVTGNFTGDYTEQITGLTGNDGTSVLMTSTYVKKKPSFTFCVANVIHGTLTYEPNDNTESCESLN